MAARGCRHHGLPARRRRGRGARLRALRRHPRDRDADRARVWAQRGSGARVVLARGFVALRLVLRGAVGGHARATLRRAARPARNVRQRARVGPHGDHPRARPLGDEHLRNLPPRRRNPLSRRALSAGTGLVGGLGHVVRERRARRSPARHHHARDDLLVRPRRAYVEQQWARRRVAEALGVAGGAPVDGRERGVGHPLVDLARPHDRAALHRPRLAPDERLPLRARVPQPPGKQRPGAAGFPRRARVRRGLSRRGAVGRRTLPLRYRDALVRLRSPRTARVDAPRRPRRGPRHLPRAARRAAHDDRATRPRGALERTAALFCGRCVRA